MPTAPGVAAYDGALSVPEPTATPVAAPSTVAAPGRSASPLPVDAVSSVGGSSEEESDASGYETESTLMIDDAPVDEDGDGDNGDEVLATFSSSKVIHESADVVRVSAFPEPTAIEPDEASSVDWAAALPPSDHWPADLADLFANNPAGANTWAEVETAMQRLVIYHAVRDTALSSCHGAPRAPRRAPALLAVAARCRCFVCF